MLTLLHMGLAMQLVKLEDERFKGLTPDERHLVNNLASHCDARRMIGFWQRRIAMLDAQSRWRRMGACTGFGVSGYDIAALRHVC